MNKKWKIILTSSLFLFGSLSFTACGGGEEQTKKEEEKKEEKKSEELTGFMCPMQCEGDKTYDEQRDCPECGMELKPAKEVVE